MISFYKNVLLPASMLAGVIIGAGVFSLPFIFERAGIGLGSFILLCVTFLVSFVYLMYADVIVRTSGDHRFIGYAQLYLGANSFWLTVLMTVVEMIFSMTIYLILGISFFSLINGLSDMNGLLLFWAVGSFLIFLNIKRVATIEFLINVGIIAIISLIFLYGLPSFDVGALGDFNFKNFILPFGPILFALAGRSAIPEMRSYLKEGGVPISYMRPAIIVGTFLPALLYFLFVIGVFGISPVASEDAVSALIGSIPGWLLVSVGFLGLFSLWSSYIILGLNVKGILFFDLKVSEFLSGLIVVGLPLALYFLGFTSFIGLVSFVGGLFLSLEGILIVLMWLKMNKVSQLPPIFVKRANFGTIVVLLAVLVIVFLNEILKLFV